MADVDFAMNARKPQRGRVLLMLPKIIYSVGHFLLIQHLIIEKSISRILAADTFFSFARLIAKNS